MSTINARNTFPPLPTIYKVDSTFVPGQLPRQSPATFSDLYRDTVTFNVERDGDGYISTAEYEAQLYEPAANAGDKLRALDKDGDGKVSTAEFRDGIDDALAGDRDAILRHLRSQSASGMSTAQPDGPLLNGEGKVSDPDAMLRFLTALFPRNTQS